jgi:hypothetical protein
MPQVGREEGEVKPETIDAMEKVRSELSAIIAVLPGLPRTSP